MTCLEHLIENTLCNFEKNKSIKEIQYGIENDCNLEYAEITPEQCWEICQYVWCTFILNNYEKIDSKEHAIKALEEQIAFAKKATESGSDMVSYEQGVLDGLSNALWIVKNIFEEDVYGK